MGMPTWSWWSRQPRKPRTQTSTTAVLAPRKECHGNLVTFWDCGVVWLSTAVNLENLALNLQVAMREAAKVAMVRLQPLLASLPVGQTPGTKSRATEAWRGCLLFKEAEGVQRKGARLVTGSVLPVTNPCGDTRSQSRS